MTSETASRVETCIKACARRAWRLAYGLVWNAEDASDVVQQACLVAAAKSDRIPADDPWPWFARVVTLECLKLRESRARAARLVVALQRELPMPQNSSDPVELAELQAKLRAGLAQLPTEQRDAVTMTQIGGMSVREAASCLGVSSSTVDRRVQQGLDGLRNKLGGKQMALGPALCALEFGEPPQGFDQAVSNWLRAVHSPASSNVPAGGLQMTALKYVGLSLAVVVLLATTLCLLHHQFVDPDAMREWHDAMWNYFHGTK